MSNPLHLTLTVSIDKLSQYQTTYLKMIKSVFKHFFFSKTNDNDRLLRILSHIKSLLQWDEHYNILMKNNIFRCYINQCNITNWVHCRIHQHRSIYCEIHIWYSKSLELFILKCYSTSQRLESSVSILD